MNAGHSAVVAGGAECLGAGGTGYSAEHFVAWGTGAEDADNYVVGVGVHFGVAFLVGFVNSITVLLLFSIFFTYKAVWSPCAILSSLSGGDHSFRDCCYLGWCFCLHRRDRCWSQGRRDWPVLSGLEKVL